ncbi:pentapeptide repeat-containing protein [Streptomyces sp. NPDC005395]|uniref:pentapeptide repeat-containing protein n=1 Tax=Streptomyces sp. NPDC005395 TaxID=3157042 RepID=UPI0033B612EA
MRLFGDQRKRHGPRLWHIWIVLPLTFLAALVIATSVFTVGWDLLAVRGLKPEHRIDSKTLFDLVKLSFGVVAGAGALVALVVAYRRQRVDEDGAMREATRLHTERFTTAVSQLGDDSAAVRLGGVHALAGLADDAPTRDLRQTCIDVLCAYLRMPYTAEADLPPDDAAARHSYLALREVRHTVIRIIRDHLREEPPGNRSWGGHNFDFTGVVFDGGDLSGSRFLSGGTVTFDRARFAAGTFDLGETRFLGGHMTFVNTEFAGAEVTFHAVRTFRGSILFRRVSFTGGVVTFRKAYFGYGCEVRFYPAEQAGGRVDFRDCGGTEPEGVRAWAEETPRPADFLLPARWRTT